MRTFDKILPILIVVIVMAFTDCKSDSKNTFTSRSDTAIAIPIENVTVSLPTTSAYQLIQTNCLMCHSAKYIEMQPALSRTEWQKVVNKMIKSYGAPISDSLIANEIIDYLVAIKGQSK